ncbi:DUF4349 domain-containing protein [Actinosynnema sp. NPDC020468]|uniref:DUF4349 domain-containing protein n=1 Tax=Actinosynnema sp. NPDC020468 TaxID=3154488 RepID=UPI003401457B
MGGRVGAAVAVAAVLALAGCASDMSSSSAGMAVDQAAPQQGVAQQGVPGQNPGQPAKEAKGEPAAVSGRQLVRTATVNLSAADVPDAFGRLKDVVTGQGGFVATENARDRRAEATLRVPADRLDAVLKAVKALDGTRVVDSTVRTEDVTDQVVDVDARLANQRASVERVRALLDKASSTAEITSIEGELTKRQSDLESLQRRHDQLADQVALSTLTVSVVESSAAPAPPADPDFLDAFAGGWNALVSGLNGLVVALGAVLPFALVLAPFAAAWWYRRRTRRQRKFLTTE